MKRVTVDRMAVVIFLGLLIAFYSSTLAYSRYALEHKLKEWLAVKISDSDSLRKGAENGRLSQKIADAMIAGNKDDVTIVQALIRVEHRALINSFQSALFATGVVVIAFLEKRAKSKGKASADVAAYVSNG